jgi:N-terminal acetyltransferase B complex non-catalytic subunit
VVDLYTQAAEQYPGNQEILTHLFMAFVRVGNYHKQQQTALLLHKAFPDNGPYYCWRVMSIVMQVCPIMMHTHTHTHTHTHACRFAP